MENAPKNEIAKSEYDPEDIWDKWLVENYHQVPDEFYDEDEKEKISSLKGVELDKVKYENAMFNFDGQIFDSDGTEFGSFSKADGKVQFEKPDYIPTPQEMEKWLDGSLRIKIDIVIQNQVDGPGSDDHMWQVRLFDQIDDKEVPNSRVLSNKLSYAIGSAFELLPSNAYEYVPIELFLKDILESARSNDNLERRVEEEQNEILGKHKDYNKIDFPKELMNKNDLFVDIFAKGNLEDYVKNNIDSLNNISNEHERMNKARTFKKDCNTLFNDFYATYRDIRDNIQNFLYNKYSYEDDLEGEDKDDYDDQDSGDLWKR